MTNYYVGYNQTDENYVYISSISITNVDVSNSHTYALAFDDEETAKGILNYVKTRISNREFKILKVTEKIEEVLENVTTDK